MLLEFLQFYRYFGLAGSLIVLVAVCLSSIFYTGLQGERYSIFNHFISELGELGVSRKACLFNKGLILGGMTLIPFVIGLGLDLQSIWGNLGMIAGLGMSGACIVVGFFPVNFLDPHIKAAITFFRTGWAAVLLFSTAVFTQPADRITVPFAVNFPGGLAALAYAAFLIFVSVKSMKGETLEKMINSDIFPERPRIWVFAFLEWMVFFTTISWIMSIALILPG